jgi:alanine racemase
MMPYRCWAEVDLGALRENLAWLRYRVGPAVKIITVVKADAYGHGLKQIAALLMQSGTDLFGVANLTEAQAVRSVGKGWPILMLGACLPHEVEGAVRDEVMPTISSLAEAKRFSTAAARFNKITRLHVKIDTGMGRLGVAPSQASDLIRRIEELPAVIIHGLCTHYSSVEDDADFSRRQGESFSGLLGQLRQTGKQFELVHASNSGALLLEPDTVFNAIRPGLLVYGVVPRGQRRIVAALQDNLRPALTWKCCISLIKDIPKGTPLSYGHTFVAPRKMRVATITAGYGDGYLRSGSNRARVLVGGKYCAVLGRITMDQMMVDVSRVPEARSGDEVVLIGRQGNGTVTANQVAEWCGTVPCEVLTNITYRVPRVYHGGHAA